MLRTIPANEVLHHWHHDRQFCIAPGLPKPLQFEGNASFSELVSRYAGDIPPGAIRTALTKAGAIVEDSDGLLSPRSRFFIQTQIDEDFIRETFFSLANLGSTVAHNAQVRAFKGGSQDIDLNKLFLERIAWTDHIAEDARREFRAWVRREGAKFIEIADGKLGEYELPQNQWTTDTHRMTGVGIFYFQED